MFLKSNHTAYYITKKIICLGLALLFFLQQTGISQAVEKVDLSDIFSELRQQFSLDKFMPARLRFLSYDLKDNDFQLLVDK